MQGPSHRFVAGRIEEAYGALDDAFAQIQSPQTAQSQLVSRRDGIAGSPNTATIVVNEVLAVMRAPLL